VKFDVLYQAQLHSSSSQHYEHALSEHSRTPQYYFPANILFSGGRILFGRAVDASDESEDIPILFYITKLL
jgi:hypothetical protein